MRRHIRRKQRLINRLLQYVLLTSKTAVPIRLESKLDKAVGFLSKLTNKIKGIFQK